MTGGTAKKQFTMNIENVVIACAAYFIDWQRQATKCAGLIAGLKS